MLNRFFSLSIRTHLLLLVFISILPSLIIILINGFEKKAQSLEIMNTRCRIFIHDLKLRQESIVASVRLLESSLANLDIVKTRNTQKCNVLFKKIIENNFEINTLAVSNTDGWVFANAVSSYEPTNVSDRKYFKDAIQSSDFSAGEYIIGRTLTKPMINFSYPVKDDTGNIIAVVQAGMHIENIHRTISLSPIPEGATLILTDYKGIILYENGNNMENSGLLTDTNEFRTAKANDRNKLLGDKLFSYKSNIIFFEGIKLRPETEPYLYFFLRVPEDNIYANSRADLYRNLIFLILAFLFAGIIAWLYGRFSITDRLKKLVNASREVMEGDLSTRVNLVKKGGEMNELANIFNLMAISLQERDEEKKRTLSEIQKSEEKYRSLFEIMAQGVLIYDSEGIITSANPAAQRILGLSHNELIGKISLKGKYDIISEDGTPFPEDKHPSMIAISQGITVENIIMGIFSENKNKYFWVIVDAIPEFKEDKNKIFQVYVTFTDITEVREISESLIISEENYRILVENIGEGITIIDLNNCFSFVNPMAARIFGVEPDYMIGRSLSDFMILELKEEILNNIHKRIQEEQNVYEFEIMRADGEKRLLSFTITPKFSQNKEVIGGLGIFRDITEIRKTEQERLRLQNLESIAVLAGGIAHDFRNILTVIQGHANIAQLKKVDPGISKNIFSILEATKIAIGLTHQLFTFAQGGSTKKDTISIRQLLEDTAKFSLFESNIQTEFVFSETEELNADPIQIKQALQNIIINAREAMPNGGKIKITTQDLIELNNKYIKISIQDSGKGIPKENLEKIFDPYFSTKTRATEKGSGFGLSVAYSIVKKHGGKIIVESEIGSGSTFNIILPTAQKKTNGK